MSKRKNPPLPRQLYGGRLNRNLIANDRPEQKTDKEPSMAISVEEMANQLSIGRNVAYQLVQHPDFPSFMVGRRVLVSRKGLQEWIDAQCRKSFEDFVIPEAPEP